MTKKLSHTAMPGMFNGNAGSFNCSLSLRGRVRAGASPRCFDLLIYGTSNKSVIWVFIPTRRSCEGRNLKRCGPKIPAFAGTTGSGSFNCSLSLRGRVRVGASPRWMQSCWKAGLHPHPGPLHQERDRIKRPWWRMRFALISIDNTNLRNVRCSYDGRIQPRRPSGAQARQDACGFTLRSNQRCPGAVGASEAGRH